MNTTNLFPYSKFPIRLDHNDSQKGIVTCFFECSEHLEKYLSRYSIDIKKCVITKADDQNQIPIPPKPKSNNSKKSKVKSSRKNK